MTEIGINVGGAAKREIGFRPGPLFFEQDGAIMFQIGLDASSIVGPYPMKARDRAEYLEAWFRFCDENPAWDVGTGARKATAIATAIDKRIDDSEGDVEPGTYLRTIMASAPSEVEEKAAIRVELDRLGAPKPHPRTGIEKLRAALAEAQS